MVFLICGLRNFFKPSRIFIIAPGISNEYIVHGFFNIFNDNLFISFNKTTLYTSLIQSCPSCCWKLQLDFKLSWYDFFSQVCLIAESIFICPNNTSEPWVPMRIRAPLSLCNKEWSIAIIVFWQMTEWLWFHSSSG